MSRLLDLAGKVLTNVRSLPESFLDKVAHVSECLWKLITNEGLQ